MISCSGVSSGMLINFHGGSSATKPQQAHKLISPAENPLMGNGPAQIQSGEGGPRSWK